MGMGNQWLSGSKEGKTLSEKNNSDWEIAHYDFSCKASMKWGSLGSADLEEYVTSTKQRALQTGWKIQMHCPLQDSYSYLWRYRKKRKSSLISWIMPSGVSNSELILKQPHLYAFRRVPWMGNLPIAKFLGKYTGKHKAGNHHALIGARTHDQWPYAP
jgi:hypothetical protein